MEPFGRRVCGQAFLRRRDCLVVEALLCKSACEERVGAFVLRFNCESVQCKPLRFRPASEREQSLGSREQLEDWGHAHASFIFSRWSRRSS